MKKKPLHESGEFMLPQLQNFRTKNAFLKSERKISQYESASSILQNKSFRNPDLNDFESPTPLSKPPENLKKALKSFGNVIKSMKYPVQLNREFKYYSHHKPRNDAEVLLSEESCNKTISEEKRGNYGLLDLNSPKFQNFDRDCKLQIRDFFDQLLLFRDLIDSKALQVGFLARRLLSERLFSLENKFSDCVKTFNEKFQALFFSKDKEHTINHLTLQITQLNKEISELSRSQEAPKLKAKEENLPQIDENEVSGRYIQYYEQAQKALEAQERKISMLFARLSAYKTRCEEHESEIQGLKEEVQRVILHKAENIELRETKRSLLETVLMQSEEILGLKIEKKQHIATFTKALSQMASLSKKMTRNYSFLVPEEKTFFANDVLNEVRTVISTEFSKIFDFSVEKDRFFEEVNLEGFQYFKPSFFHCFLKPGRSPGLAEKEPSAKANVLLLITIRGIFDSKHHEYLISDNFRSFSKFPDFVYSWLLSFYVDEERRCVYDRTFPGNSEIAYKFTEQLLRFNKGWELLAFKDFLEEKSSPDEVFFYLHCRFLLFNGPQLKRLSGRFDYVDYVRLEQVVKVLDLIFRSFDHETRGFIINKLQAKSKPKGTSVLIDSAFALRIFLEYYKLERMLIYRLVVKSFTSVCKVQTIRDFSPFERILGKMIPTCNCLDKIDLFRQCFEVSRDGINPEAIFTVFSESGFLIKIIKSQFFVNPEKEADYNATLNFINAHLKKLNNEMVFIRARIQNLGLEALKEEFVQYYSIFIEKNYAFFKKNSFMGKNLFMVFSRMIELIIKVRNMEIFNGFNGCEEELFFLRNDFLATDVILGQIKTLMGKEKLREFEHSRSAKKIQTRVRRKLDKWKILIGQLLASKTTKGD